MKIQRCLMGALSALFLFLMAGAVNAQQDKLKLKVRMSMDEQAEDRRQPRSLFRVSTKNIMVMRVRDEGPGVQPFDRMEPKFELYDRNKLGVHRSQEPVLKVPAGLLFLEDLVLFGGDPLMIAARRDTINGKVQLYWQRLDPNLTRLHPPFEPLCTFDARVTGTGEVIPEGSAFRDPFYTVFSPDTNLMLVYAPEVIGIDGKNRQLMVVVDKTMKVQWQRTMDVPATRRFTDIQVDNQGNAFVVDRVKAKVADKKDTTSYSLEVTFVNGENIAACETGLGDDRFIKSVKFRAMPDGRVCMAGIHGGLDGRGDQTLTNFISFLVPGEAKAEVLSSWTIEYDGEDAWMAKGMRLLDILPRPKGGFYLVNEYYIQTSESDTKLALSGLRWVHGPLMIIKTDAEGQEEWTSIFRRLHVTDNIRVGEPFPMLFDDELVIFMLDSEEQVARRKEKTEEQSHLEMKQPYSAYLHVADETSDRTKSVLRSSGANDYIQGTKLFHSAKGEYFVLGSSKLGANKLLPVKIELMQ